MELLLLGLLIWSCSKDASNKRKDLEEKQRKDKGNEWKEKVENMSLERAIKDELFRKTKGNRLDRELQEVCDKIGVDYKQLCDYEKIFILMVNRGCLPTNVSFGGYKEPSDYVVQFDPSTYKDNAIKVVPWAINRLKDFGVYDSVFAHLKGGGYSKLYVKVGSEAYNYLLKMGVKFSEFVWETRMWPTDLKAAVVEVKQIGEEDMSAFRQLAKRLTVTKL